MPAFMNTVSGTTPVILYVVKPMSKVRINQVMIYNADSANHVVTIAAAKLNADGSIDTNAMKPLLPGIPVAASALFNDQVPEAEVASSQTEIYAVVAYLDAAASTPVQVAVNIVPEEEWGR